MGASQQIDKGRQIVAILISIGLVIVLGVVFYGNLSGNVGFTVNTVNYNNSQHVINNQTSGLLSFSSNATTLYDLAVVVLIITLVAILFVVGMKSMNSKGKGGFS